MGGPKIRRNSAGWDSVTGVCSGPRRARPTKATTEGRLTGMGWPGAGYPPTVIPVFQVSSDPASMMA